MYRIHFPRLFQKLKPVLLGLEFRSSYWSNGWFLVRWSPLEGSEWKSGGRSSLFLVSKSSSRHKQFVYISQDLFEVATSEEISSMKRR